MIYINDIPESASFAKCIMYVEDANIIMTADTIEIINSQLVQGKTKNCWAGAESLKNMIFSQSRNISLPSPVIISNAAIITKIRGQVSYSRN